MKQHFLGLKPQRVFCIGRNYVAHAEELNNPLPESPIVFMKPSSALVLPGEPLPHPRHGKDVHHEVEVVILIGREGVVEDLSHAHDFIAGIGLGLDLTLRDLQQSLAKQGLPWEKAKAFDASAPIGSLIPFTHEMDLFQLEFSCAINGAIKQQGKTSHMIFSIDQLLLHLSQAWKLLPGDLIYTGTPAGVGPLRVGDTISISAPWFPTYEWKMG